ncbi:MAG: helix-turn-helix domain-containing protein [Thermoguttaceae bacterium]|jgi:transposase|nr:helix-turn-helix domain-containing protein [Thermoguttaceae bacterium]
MEVWKQVQQTWQALLKRQRRIVRSYAKGSPDAVLRCRCKIIVALVQGRRPAQIAQMGLASASQVYRVGRRFQEEGLAGLADRREDNGDNKVTEEYEAALWEVVAGSPQD